MCKLKRSIYGLKQALRSWNIFFDNEIKEFSFIRNSDKPCIYNKVSGSARAFLILYLDDILLIGNDIGMLMSIKLWLSNKFSIKDLRDVTYILGIRIYRDRARKSIGLSQSLYIEKMLKRFSMKSSKKGFIPFKHGIYLSKGMSPYYTPIIGIGRELEARTEGPFGSFLWKVPSEGSLGS